MTISMTASRIEKPSEESSPTTLGLIQTIDSEFKPSYRMIWLKHNLLDLVVAGSILLILVILGLILFVIQPNFMELSESNITLLFSTLEEIKYQQSISVRMHSLLHILRVILRSLLMAFQLWLER